MQSLFIIMPKILLSAPLPGGLLIHLWKTAEKYRDILSAPETYAVVLKETNEPMGSVGIMFADGVHSADMQDGDAEIGYWIGVPYWGQGLIPEAVQRLLKRCFVELDVKRVWCGHYDGNIKSRRVMEKCGFKYHHTEEGKDFSVRRYPYKNILLCLPERTGKTVKRNIKMSHDKNYDKIILYRLIWNLSGILSLHFTTIHGEVT